MQRQDVKRYVYILSLSSDNQEEKVMTTDLNNVAKQVGVSINALQSNIDEVVASNAEAWTSAGISADDQQKRAIRIAARQIITRSRAIASSGCVELKGVFVSRPI